MGVTITITHDKRFKVDIPLEFITIENITIAIFSIISDIVDQKGIQLFLLNDNMSIQYYIPAVSS